MTPNSTEIEEAGSVEEEKEVEEEENPTVKKPKKELRMLSCVIEDLAYTIKLLDKGGASTSQGTHVHKGPSKDQLKQEKEKLEQKREAVYQAQRKLNLKPAQLKALFTEAPEPLICEEDLCHLYDNLESKLKHLSRNTQGWSGCLPILLVPEQDQMMDERHIAVWRYDLLPSRSGPKPGLVFPVRAKFKEFSGGSMFDVSMANGYGVAATEKQDAIGMTHHWPALNMRLLVDPDSAGLTLMPKEEFVKLWKSRPRRNGEPSAYYIDYKASCDLDLGYPAVGDELVEKGDEGRQVWAKAHGYFRGELKQSDGESPTRTKPSPPVYSIKERDARYLGSNMHTSLQQRLLKVYGEHTIDIAIDKVDFCIHSDKKTKQVLKEHGVWDDYIRKDGDQTDHIISPIWGGANHFMNYFIMPRDTNAAFGERFTVKKKGKAVNNKRAEVGYEAYHTAHLFEGVALEHVRENKDGATMSNLIAEVKERGRKDANKAMDEDEIPENVRIHGTRGPAGGGGPPRGQATTTRGGGRSRGGRRKAGAGQGRAGGNPHGAPSAGRGGTIPKFFKRKREEGNQAPSLHGAREEAKEHPSISRGGATHTRSQANSMQEAEERPSQQGGAASSVPTPNAAKPSGPQDAAVTPKKPRSSPQKTPTSSPCKPKVLSFDDAKKANQRSPNRRAKQDPHQPSSGKRPRQDTGSTIDLTNETDE